MGRKAKINTYSCKCGYHKILATNSNFKLNYSSDEKSICPLCKTKLKCIKDKSKEPYKEPLHIKYDSNEYISTNITKVSLGLMYDYKHTYNCTKCGKVITKSEITDKTIPRFYTRGGVNTRVVICNNCGNKDIIFEDEIERITKNGIVKVDKEKFKSIIELTDDKGRTIKLQSTKFSHAYLFKTIFELFNKVDIEEK